MLAGGRGWTSSTPLYVGNLLRHGFRNRLKFHVLKSNRHGFRNRLKCHLLSLIVVFCHEIHDVSLMKLFPNLLFMIRDKTRSKGEAHIHWVTWGTGTPKDRDEVNKLEVRGCDG